MSVPFSLIFEQSAMLKCLGRVLVKSLFPFGRPKQNPDRFEPDETFVPAPSERLLKQYLKWCGAAEGSYREHLPPHLFCQYALPTCLRQLEQLSYRLSSVINQGCSFTVHAPLPKGLPLQLTCRIDSITEMDGRARVKQSLQIGTQETVCALEVNVHTTFILERGKKRERPPVETPKLRDISRWSAMESDGRDFALLTGDFNPIHWLTPLARLSPFGGKVLHGFGSFARCFEALQRDLVLQGKPPIKHCRVRFVRPVPLPSEPLQLLASTEPVEQGGYHWELQDSNENSLLVGSFSV